MQAAVLLVLLLALWAGSDPQGAGFDPQDAGSQGTGSDPQGAGAGSQGADPQSAAPQGSTQDGTPVLSALWGGLIALVSQGWAAWRLQRGGPGRTPQQMARDGYAAEVGKFALAAAGFGAVFALVRPLSPGMVFAAFGLLTAIHLLGTWRVLRTMTKDE